MNKYIWLFIAFSALWFSIPSHYGYDIWWHIEVGNDILSGIWPDPDIYSCSKLSHPWTIHSWLSDIIFFFVYSFSEIWGIIVLTVSIKIATALLISHHIFRKTHSVEYTAFTFLFCAVSISRMVARPYLFSVLLSIALFVILDSQPSKKQFFTIPFIFLLWVNLHPGFIFGLVILMAYFIQCIVSRRIERIVIITFSLSFVFTLINPYHYHIYNYIMEASAHPSTDWFPMRFIFTTNVHPYVLAQIIVLFFLLYQVIPHRRLFVKEDNFIFYTILLLLCLFFPFKHIRLSWFMLFPVVILIQLNYVRKSVFNFFFQTQYNQRAFVAILTAAVLVLIPIKNVYKVKYKLPFDCINYIKENEIKGNIFAPPEWGGIIIHQLRNCARPFIDTRLELYRHDVYYDYLRILHDPVKSQELLEKYKINIVLAHPDWIEDMKWLNDPAKWNRLFDTDNAIIFLSRR